MPRATLIDKRTSGIIRPLGFMAMVYLTFGSSQRAFPAEETVAPPSEGLAQLQFAPVQFQPSLNGSIDYLLRRDRYSGIQTTSQALAVSVTAGANFNSFIWQPWFAQVGGGLGWSISTTDTSYNTGAESTSGKTASTLLTGKTSLDLVPLSRFPFRAYWERDDNRQNTGFASPNTETQNTRFGLSQQYRTLSGQTSYGATYDQNLMDGGFFGVSKQKQLNLNMGTELSSNQNLNISNNNVKNDSESNNQSTLINTVVVQHNYRPNAAVTVQNVANAGRTDYSLAQGDNENRYAQLNSFATWALPGEKPLTISGAALLSTYSNITPSGTSTQSTASANLGANYQLSRQVRTYGNAGFNLNDNKDTGSQTMSSNEAAGADYRSDLRDLGIFRYGTHATVNLSNNHSPVIGSTQSVNLSAGHNLSLTSTDPSGIRKDTNLDQTITENKVTNNHPLSSLAHTGSMAWTFAGGSGSTGLRLSASDNRTLNNPRSYFQLANLQLNRNENMTRNSTLNGSLTMQASRQATPNAPSAPTTFTSSANLNYTHQRIFGVPRLDFTSILQIYSNSLTLTVGPQTSASRSWTNQLLYSIGQLRMYADLDFAEHNNLVQSTLLFRLNRVF